jgi:hypothetical protein
MLVPPDPNRRFVSKAEYKQVFAAGAQRDAHGFAFVDPAELKASNGAAGYYDWSPAPGFRFIALDTVSQGGIAGPGAEGNIDDPEFRWVERRLKAATARGELIVLFGHHPIRSLRFKVPDEAAPPCSGPDAHGHDTNPGCDLDPRPSTPVHDGPDLVALLHRYPNVIALVAGHTHENLVTPFPKPGGGGFWGIETAAEVDWPQQSRLIEIMDNEDGTLSIFGTALDQAAPLGIPASGTSAAAFSVTTLASIARALSYNDPQLGGGTGEGRTTDHNVELLVRDPRPPGRRGGTGSPCRARIAPRTAISRRALRAARRGLSASGTARDRDCAGGRRTKAGRVARVYAAVGRVVAGGCRFLRRDGRFAARRSCRRPLYLRVPTRYDRRRTITSWALRRRVALPRGVYDLTVRAVDVHGTAESRRHAGRFARFRVR